MTGYVNAKGGGPLRRRYNLTYGTLHSDTGATDWRIIFRQVAEICEFTWLANFKWQRERRSSRPRTSHKSRRPSARPPRAEAPRSRGLRPQPKSLIEALGLQRVNESRSIETCGQAANGGPTPTGDASKRGRGGGAAPRPRLRPKTTGRFANEESRSSNSPLLVVVHLLSHPHPRAVGAAAAPTAMAEQLHPAARTALPTSTLYFLNGGFSHF